jgi:PAS domain S-box-containing protein
MLLFSKDISPEDWEKTPTSVKDLIRELQSQLETQQQESQYSQVVESQTDFVLRSLPDTTITFANEALCRALGCSREQVIGKKWLDFANPEDLQSIVQHISELTPTNPSFVAENRDRRADGQLGWTQWLNQGIFDPEGQLVAIQSTGRDITSLKQVEETLRRSEARFKNIATQLPGAIILYTLHPDGSDTVIYASPGCYELWEMETHLVEQNAQVLWDVIHPDDVSAMRVSVLESAQTLQPWFYTWRIITPSGQLKWLQGAGRPTQCTNGDIIWDTVVLDVSRQKQLELDLQASEASLNDIINSAITAISRIRVFSNSTWEYDFCSAGHEKVCGYTAQELLADPTLWASRVLPDDMEQVMPAVFSKIFLGQDVAYEYRFQHKDNTLRWIAATLASRRDEANDCWSVTVVSTDITDLKLAEARLRQAAERERFVQAVIKRIRQSLDPEEVLRTTVREVRQILKTNRVLIFKLDRDGIGHVVQESVDGRWRSILGEEIYDPCFKADYAQRYFQGRIGAIADIHDGSLQACHAKFLGQLDVRANLIAPIIQTNYLWGLLIAHQCDQPRQWTEEDIELLKQLADQLAIAIQQSELCHQLQQLNTKLESQVKQRTQSLQQALEFESLLQRISDKVRETLDEAQAIQTAVMELSLVLKTHVCGVSLFDLQAQTSTIYYEQINADMPSTKGTQLLFSSDPAFYQQLLDGYHFQFCWSYNQLYPFKWKYPQGTWLACPLIGDGGVLGKLWLYRVGDTVFKDAEVRLVKQVANQCAIGIRQARLYQMAQIQVKNLETLHQLKDDFLSTVSHELRSPMTNIRMAIQMVELTLQKHAFQNDLVDRYLKILKDECSQELNLINDLLDLQRLEAGVQSLELEPIEMHYYLPQIVEAFADRIQAQKQILQVNIPSDLPTITTDLTSFRRILMELLHNACKYTPSGEQISVTAQLLQTGLQIQISNTGVEIPSESLPRLFEKFYRVPNLDRQKHGGTGLGLALIKRLIEHLNGSITVASAHARTCFTVYLPLSPT